MLAIVKLTLSYSHSVSMPGSVGTTSGIAKFGVTERRISSIALLLALGELVPQHLSFPGDPDYLHMHRMVSAYL